MNSYTMEDKYILKGTTPKEALFPRSAGIQLFYALKEHSKTDKFAFTDITTHQSLTYKELFETSVKVAINLKKLGYAGKFIAIYCENRKEFYIPVVAAFYLGSPVIFINPGYKESELLHACELSEPSFIFCSNQTHKIIAKLKSNQPMDYLQQIWKIENLSKLCCGVRVGTELEFHPSEVDPNEDIASLFFSSGTTGLPKAVVHSHKNVNFVHRAFCNEDILMSTFTNYILTPTFYHVYGFYFGTGSLLRGYTVKFYEKFNLNVFLSAIEKYKITALPVVPTILVLLANHPLVSKYDLSSLKIIMCGSASCSRALEMAVVKRLPNIRTVYQVFGMTETTHSVISVPTLKEPKVGSLGLVEPGVEMKVRNSQTNETLGPKQVGEFCFRGDTIMKGYYRNPEALKAAIDENGWYFSGDLGYYDDDGYIFSVDRLKELIKFKGFQVSPAELKGILVTHPKIMDAAVLGYLDNAAGELPMAFVVKKTGVEVNEEEIIDFIKGKVSYPKQLHGGVRFVDSIPKSRAGKILRRELHNLLNVEVQNSKL